MMLAAAIMTASDEGHGGLGYQGSAVALNAAVVARAAFLFKEGAYIDRILNTA